MSDDVERLAELSNAEMTDASHEVLASQRRVIEQVREMAFPDQIGQPIEQAAMHALLRLAEEQAVERYLAQAEAELEGLREALRTIRATVEDVVRNAAARARPGEKVHDFISDAQLHAISDVARAALDEDEADKGSATVEAADGGREAAGSTPRTRAGREGLWEAASKYAAVVSERYHGRATWVAVAGADAALRAALAAEDHYPQGIGVSVAYWPMAERECTTCGESWPCPSARAAEGERG